MQRISLSSAVVDDLFKHCLLGMPLKSDGGYTAFPFVHITFGWVCQAGSAGGQATVTRCMTLAEPHDPV